MEKIKLDCMHTMHRRGEVAWVLQKTQTGSRSVALLSCILFILKIDPWTLHFPEFGRNLLEKYFKPSKYDTRQEEHWHCWLVLNNMDIDLHRFHNIWWKRKHSPCWKHTMKRSTPFLHFVGAHRYIYLLILRLVLVKSLWRWIRAHLSNQWVFKHRKST